MSFNRNQHCVSIENYLADYKKKKYSLPRWQRDDCWTNEYKRDLILSILMGIDIPKIYIGTIKGSKKKYIIDGGHRTRAMFGFYNNEFPINIGGVETYYNLELHQDTRHTGILADDDLENFNEFNLSIVEYKNISESDCRFIFNRLQNSEPMTVPDVVNSIESDLVDFLRETTEHKILGVTMMEHFLLNKSLSKPDNNEILYQLLSWFTIIFPRGYVDDEIEEPETLAMKYLKMGKTRDSPCLRYVKKFNEEITEEIRAGFYLALEFIVNYITSTENKVPATDLNSLVFSNHYYKDTFSIEKFNLFTETIRTYDKQKKDAAAQNKKKNYDTAELLNKEADALNTIWGDNLETWLKSRRNGGNDLGGMVVRDEIIKSRCFY
jgi:hypothetical protein